jgi:hypothetical protein
VLCPAARLVIVVVVDDLDGAISKASTESRTPPAISTMSEAVEHGLNAFKGECACGNSGSSLESSSQEARLAHRNILCLLILRRSVGRRRSRVLRRDLLITRAGSLLLRLSIGLLVAITEEPAQKAGGMSRLRTLLLKLLKLLLKLTQLRSCLIKRDVLDKDRLREHVERVRVPGKALIEQGLCVRILFLERSLIQAIDEGIKKLFFLGSHESNLRRSFTVHAARLS